MDSPLARLITHHDNWIETKQTSRQAILIVYLSVQTPTQIVLETKQTGSQDTLTDSYDIHANNLDTQTV